MPWDDQFREKALYLIVEGLFFKAQQLLLDITYLHGQKQINHKTAEIRGLL